MTITKINALGLTYQSPRVSFDLANSPVKVSVLSLDEKEVIYLSESEYETAKGYTSTPVGYVQSSIRECSAKDVRILRAALILCKAREQKTKMKLLVAKINKSTRE
jgi:hypothetical protein